MKTARIWLLTMAAIAMTAPLAAQEINAPEPRWRGTATVETSVVNWPRLAWVAEEAEKDAAAQGTADEVAQQAAQQPTGQTTSAPQAPLAQQTGVLPAAQDDTQHNKAEEQIKEQEHQRVLGLLPSFNVSYRSDAVSLTGWQKIRLAFRTTVDPVTFGVAFVVAGYHEGANDLSGFPWGVKGYGERAAAAYLDSFDGTMIGNGILPALLHQDPRFFRLGHGSVAHRLFYAASTAFICKHDNTGKWEPNYSNVMGNIASGAISNLYYPGSNSGIGLTISNGLIQTAAGAFGGVFQEFWPDISRKLLHKDPTHGLDAAQASATVNPAASQPRADKP